MKRFLHIAERKPSPRVWTESFCERVRALGELVVVDNGEKLSVDERVKLMGECSILITCWDAAPVPPSVAGAPGKLEYICHVTGSMRDMIPIEIIDSSIPVTNWGDAPAGRLAEGVFALLLALVKDLPHRARVIESGGWRPPADLHSGTLEGLKVGVYGYGVIGRRFVEMLRPFGAVIRIFDPYVSEFPEDCIAVESLDELFARSEAIAIHAGLNDETRGSVTAELLSKLPPNGIVINVARGAIVDQEALFAELESGRLRAGLDVLDPDTLPPDHPARKWENLILTAHSIGREHRMDGSGKVPLSAMHHICLDNIRRHLAGEPLRFVMDRDRYLRST